MVSLMPSYKNLTYDNLGRTGKLYPNADPEHSDGTVVMFDERFNTDDGLGAPGARRVAAGQGAARRASTRSCSTPAGCSSTGTPGR